jgi:peroxiredoxin (alkyl hydroperoxide reductase subunit C)
MFNTLKINRQAPNFELTGLADKNTSKIYKLEDYQNQKLILVFYGGDFEKNSITELNNLQQNLKTLKQKNYQVLACSTDSLSVHKAFLDSFEKLEIPLLSDIHHITAIDFQVFREESAGCFAGFFVIENLLIKSFHIQDIDTARNFETLINLL